MPFLKLMYITNNPEVALIAQKYNVDRIWIDLETLGKEERQGHINSVKSNHTINDIKKIAPLLDKSELLVRVNPINDTSKEEINKTIEAGANIIMLPMWKSLQEVQTFLNYVNGRVKTILLLETKEGVECLNSILEYGGFDEIHIGLNDLHLSYNLKFMFELLSNGLVEEICKKIQKYNIPYGFGGIAKLGEGMLPAEKIIMEHYRLGSTRVILSRTFCNTKEIQDPKDVDSIFEKNLKRLYDFEDEITHLKKKDFIKNEKSVKENVELILKNMEENTKCT